MLYFLKMCAGGCADWEEEHADHAGTGKCISLPSVGRTAQTPALHGSGNPGAGGNAFPVCGGERERCDFHDDQQLCKAKGNPAARSEKIWAGAACAAHGRMSAEKGAFHQ